MIDLEKFLKSNFENNFRPTLAPFISDTSATVYIHSATLSSNLLSHPWHEMRRKRTRFDPVLILSENESKEIKQRRHIPFITL